ncbi:MAG: hypothetical protein FWE67_00595 [Planctomycetaceae bacterium]|nr:hypothetical protein [Planctomycetaceae bacterium]
MPGYLPPVDTGGCQFRSQPAAQSRSPYFTIAVLFDITSTVEVPIQFQPTH